MSEALALTVTETPLISMFVILAVFVWFAYISLKLKEVYLSGETLLIKNEDTYEEIPIRNITGKVSMTLIFRGAYRINFLNSTKYGKSILIEPRHEWLFFKHEAFKNFIKTVNT